MSCATMLCAFRATEFVQLKCVFIKTFSCVIITFITLFCTTRPVNKIKMINWHWISNKLYVLFEQLISCNGNAYSLKLNLHFKTLSYAWSLNSCIFSYSKTCQKKWIDFFKNNFMCFPRNWIRATKMRIH